MSVSVKLKFNKPIPQIAKEVTRGDATALFMANTARRFMSPFVPYRKGDLRDNVDISVEGGHGIVHYTSIYAHYQYCGVGFKHTTGGTTAYWDRAMMQVRKADLVRDVQAFVKGG